MVLVERDEHLGHLAALLEDSLIREGRVALIEGPVASGKTALMHTFAEHATSSGALFLKATCANSERTLQFGVLRQLLRCGNLPADVKARVEWLLERGASSVADITSISDAADPEVVQLFDNLCVELLELATETPILIGVDDVHYADAPSLLCLLHLIRRSMSVRIMVVLTEDRSLQVQHSPFRTELLRQPHFHRLRLGPLSRDGVHRLVTAHLADETASGRVAGEFFEASGGNPLLLSSLVEDYQPSGDIFAGGYGPALLGCLHRGESIMLRVAQAMAALGETASPSDLSRLIEADVDAVERALQAMTDAGLLDNGRFRDAAARSAVLADLPVSIRSDLHRRAARLLHDQDAQAMAIAHHLLEADEAGQTRQADQAGHEAWAVDVLLKASEQAVVDSDIQAAANCLRLADRSCAHEADRAGIRAKLAQVEWQIDPAAAARHLDSLTAKVRAGELDGSDHLLLVRHLLWHGRIDEAVDVLDRMRESAAGPPGDAHIDTTAELRDIELWLTCSHPPLAQRRRLPAGRADQRDTLVTPHSVAPNTDPWLRSAAILADLLGHGATEEAVDKAVQVLRNLHLGRTTSWANESALLALLVLICADKPDTATDWCERLMAEADTRNAPAWQAMFAAARAEIAVRQGDLATAVRHARTALTDMAPKAWGVAIGLPLGGLILAATRMGDYEEAAKLLTEPVPDSMFDTRYGLHYLYARGHYYLATDHNHAALADFLSCGKLMRDWGLDVATLIPWRTSAAEAWLRLDNRDQARQLIHDQQAQSRNDAPRTRGLSLRLLAAISSPNRRPQLLLEALELFEECGDRFEQARVLADLSRAYHMLGNNRRARMVFRRALHVAKMCEANPLCHELLSIPDISGTAPDMESPTRIGALTDSERRVASLAVMGYTNLEIAAKLYITPSTVEQHLTRVYRKLGVKGRKDLPVELGTELARTASRV